jgi:hypothetical protein
MLKRLRNLFNSNDNLDEFKKFNQSSLAKKCGVSVELHEYDDTCMLELHDPLENVIHVFHLNSKESAIEHLEAIKKELEDNVEQRQKKFVAVIAKASEEVAAHNKIDCYHMSKFIAMRYLRMVKFNPKKMKDMLNSLQPFFTE